MTTILNNGSVLFEHYADLQAVLDANNRRLPDSYKPAQFKCASCSAVEPLYTERGNALYAVSDNAFKCYECCGKDDAAILRAGKEPICLFLVNRGIGDNRVINWPGTLEVFVNSTTESSSVVFGRNVSRRQHVKFAFEGIEWYGDVFGDAQLCRCYPVGYHRKQRQERNDADSNNQKGMEYFS